MNPTQPVQPTHLTQPTQPTPAPGRTYRGADPKQRQVERRARLVEAAIEIFGTVGYRNATVERICAAAGLTKRYFYESFDDSEGLLLATYAQVADDLGTRIFAGAQAAAPDVDAQVRAALTTLFRIIHEDRRLARIAFVEVLAVSPTVDHAYRTVNVAFVDMMLHVAKPVLDASGLPDTDLKILVTGLLGAIILIAQQWILTDQDQPIDAIVTNAHTLVMAVLGRIDPR